MCGCLNHEANFRGKIFIELKMNRFIKTICPKYRRSNEKQAKCTAPTAIAFECEIRTFFQIYCLPITSGKIRASAVNSGDQRQRRASAGR